MTLDQNQTLALHGPPVSAVDVPHAGTSRADSFLEQVTAALTKAVHENLYRSRLMALSGHDLKQPLQVITLLLDSLAAQIPDPSARPRLQLAHQSVKRIADGLDRLAMASRFDLDLDSPRRSTFPIGDILQLIEPTWQEHAARKGIKLRVVPSSAYVTSDAAMLTTIVDNLIGNAIKYTVRGCVLVGCRRLKRHLSIQVLDTGVGIKAERLARIFDAFHQENPTSDGFGLGLSIVHRTAATLAHPMRVESAFGRGSIFSLEVPLGPRAAVDG